VTRHNNGKEHCVSVYHPGRPTSATELIMALRRLIDAIIDGTASRQPSHTLDTVYAAINYLAAAEHLCTGCGRPLGSPHADHCRQLPVAGYQLPE